MVEIPLSNGIDKALIDDEDEALVRQYTWQLFVNKEGNSRYAITRFKQGGKYRSLRMHCLIKPGIRLLDHEDRDGLNNQKANLRPANHTTNAYNAAPYRTKGRTSRFKGVSFDKRARPASRPWRSKLRAEGKDYYLGTFGTEEEAALAFDAGAIKFHGEFAYLNFPDEKPRGDFQTSTVNRKTPSTALSILPLASVLLADEEAA